MLSVDYLVSVHTELITREEHAITHNDLLTNNAILRDTKDENDILVSIPSSVAVNESTGIHVETWIFTHTSTAAVSALPRMNVF